MKLKLLLLMAVAAAAGADAQNTSASWGSAGTSGTAMAGSGTSAQSSAGQPVGGTSGGSTSSGTALQGGFLSNPVVRGPVSSVGETGGVPAAFALAQNYPNPFNPTTTIRFTLPHASAVSLTVYNLLGEEVMRLADEWREAGEHSVRLDARGFASGVYFYRLRAGSFGAIKSMVVVKETEPPRGGPPPAATRAELSGVSYRRRTIVRATAKLPSVSLAT